MELDKERARKRWREIRWKIEKEMLGARRKEGGFKTRKIPFFLEKSKINMDTTRQQTILLF